MGRTNRSEDKEDMVIKIRIGSSNHIEENDENFFRPPILDQIRERFSQISMLNFSFEIDPYQRFNRSFLQRYWIKDANKTEWVTLFSILHEELLDAFIDLQMDMRPKGPQSHEVKFEGRGLRGENIETWIARDLHGEIYLYIQLDPNK